MGKKRKGGLLSSCFGSGSDDQPEIRYEPDGDGIVQSVVLEDPMPDINELDEKFAELVVSFKIHSLQLKLFCFAFVF